MSSTIDKWEADAKANIDAAINENHVIRSNRILALIELVRAKDEFIQEMIDSLHCDHHWQAKEALALTKELK